MLPKRFIEFNNIHKGDKIVVCGCGMSLLNFKEHAPDFITIGTNDVPALFDPTYHLVTDHPNRFNESRKKLINGTSAKYLFTCVGGWRHPNIVLFELGKKGSANLTVPDKVDHHLNSPYAAINIAYKLGATKIGFIGVDFTDGHFYSKNDGPHSLDRMGYLSDLKWGYNHIRQELAKLGVDLYNLSINSKIDNVPYMSIEDFKEL